MSLYDEDHAEQPPETVTFFTCGLISKWGFNDGDLLEWLNEHGDFGDGEVLAHIVKTRLVPSLNATIEVWDVGSIHNPIRAKLINGIEPDWYKEDLRFDWLSPASIELTGAEVLAIARSLYSSKKATCPACLKEVSPDPDKAAWSNPSKPHWNICPHCGHGFNAYQHRIDKSF